MDGTLVLGDRANRGLAPLPGAAEMLAWVRGRGLPYVVFTNGTNRSPAHFASVLRDAGLDVRDAQMMTPASSAVVMCVLLTRGQGARRRAWFHGTCPGVSIRGSPVRLQGKTGHDPER
jgi:ribonucleotide monophosphatase NagD (HAD superfamily)